MWLLGRLKADTEFEDAHPEREQRVFSPLPLHPSPSPVD
jgi:hypothetical protein